jgi:hypothetical protein
VLCNLLGEEMERGLIPDDLPLIGTIVKRICFDNASDYLCLSAPLDPATAGSALSLLGTRSGCGISPQKHWSISASGYRLEPSSEYH